MHSFSRRRFLQSSLMAAGASTFIPYLRSLAWTFSDAQQTGDEEVCKRKFTLALEQSLREKPIGEVMVAIGTSFLGTPYVAHALEAPGDERLVINMQGLDCVSFTENSLALSRCVKMGTATFEAYRKQMQLIRYRNGKIDGYPSRLHYFSDWIDNNVAKKVVRNVTEEIGGRPYTKRIDYMSPPPDSYRQLSDAAFMAKIKRTENELMKRSHYYIPKEHLAGVQKKIDNGDIIAITTSMKGMDIAHTGMAIRVGDELKLLHAPIVGSSVQISEHTLVEYLKRHATQTGIMVARPLEPAA